MRWITRVLIVGVLWLPAIPTAAQTKDPHALSAGRKLAAEGDKAWAAQDFKKAFDRFSRAYDLVKAPALAVRKAECLLKLGRLVEASEAYMQIVRVELPADAPLVSRQAVETARRESTTLRARLPTVSIVVEGLRLDGATVTVDGKEVPQALWGTKFPIDPGTHRVEVVKGARTVSEELTISERESKALSLLLPGGEGEPAPPPTTTGSPPPTPPPTSAPPGQPPPVAAESPTPSSQRTWGWVGLGIGGAGLALGGVTGALVLSKRSSLDENCVDGVCPVSRQSDVDSYNTMRTVSVIGFGVGLAGAATGLVLLLTAPDEPAGVATNGSVLAAGVRPWVGAGAAGLEGKF